MAKAESPELQTEKYYRLSFQPKTHPNDTRDVELMVNGETLIIEREKEVVIPERFKVCADNAVYRTFSQAPGEDRKVTGTVRIYPYNLIGPGTREEYMKQRAEGTKASKQRLREMGML